MTSHRQGPRRAAAQSAATAAGAERQQALLLDALRDADGGVLSYGELRRRGVEFPASVVFELQLAGVALEREFAGSGAGRHAVGVRLAPASDVGAPAEAVAASARWGAVRRYRTSPVRIALERLLALPPELVGGRLRIRAGGRVLAPAALMLAAAVVAAVVVAELPGSAPGHRAARLHRPRGALAQHPTGAVAQRPGGHALTKRPQNSLTGQAQTQTPPTPVSPALAVQLEAHGHDLLVSGQYGAAVPVLERAVAATGESSGACLEPTTEACLTYAFALYDLGRALRLGGQPSAAVAVLTRRLQIDNQRPVVAAELALARQEAK